MTNIARVDYNYVVSSIDIFCSGCNPPYCDGCHNIELFDFNQGEPYNINYHNKIKEYLEDYSGLVKIISLLGGSWTHQTNYKSALYDIKKLCMDFNKPLMLFAREELNEIHKDFKEVCDFMKTGKYIVNSKSIESHGIILASENQKIHQKGIDYS